MDPEFYSRNRTGDLMSRVTNDLNAVRMVLGPDHVRLLPATALAGALFLLAADTVARTAIAPAELPVGVLTAFIGGPFFLYLLRRTRQELMP